MKLKLSLIALFTALIGFSIQANAQCRTFVKNNCNDKLEDYNIGGRMYGGYVSQGQELELNIVLNGGQKYRLINCSKDNLGIVQVVLFDSKGNVVFDNSEHEFVDTWDFDVKSTQEFLVKTILPSPTSSHGSTVRDCNILIIGSKSSS